MSSIDQEFVEFVVKSLVGNPDAVTIERRIDEKGVLLELTVDPEDLGRVIGKRGATAQSIRTLLRALGTKNDARYNLKIVDVSGGEGYTPRPQAAASDDNSSASATTDDVAGGIDIEPETKPTSSNLSTKTRKELEELDDLDI
ncbi:MAG: KH domain-containing protein [Candidatus Saccharimonadales bacterium]